MNLQSQVLNAINRERMKAGVKALVERPDITGSADLRAKESATAWSHTRPDGSPFYTANNMIYGENLAKDFRTAEEIVAAWMKSDIHRKVMLDARYQGASVGVYDNGKMYVSLELTL